MGYVSYEYYISKYNHLKDLDINDIQILLDEASNDIDILTFNRIRAKQFYNLTNYQKEKIQTVICELMEFHYNNKDFLTSIFNQYNVNGTGFDMNNSNYIILNGVPILKNTYKKLEQTGLTYRGGRY